MMSGVVFETTGGLSATAGLGRALKLCGEIDVIVEDGHVVGAKQIEELAAADAQERGGLSRREFAEIVEPHKQRLAGQVLKALRGLAGQDQQLSRIGDLEVAHRLFLACRSAPVEFGYMLATWGKTEPPAEAAEGFVMGCLMGLEPTTS